MDENCHRHVLKSPMLDGALSQLSAFTSLHTVSLRKFKFVDKFITSKFPAKSDGKI
jgi:hypothetical protein